MIRRLVVLISVVGVVGFVARAVVPDIRRYLKIREM
jgi:hypothetical protein